jgi:hypothetical protein
MLQLADAGVSGKSSHSDFAQKARWTCPRRQVQKARIGRTPKVSDVVST